MSDNSEYVPKEKADFNPRVVHERDPKTGRVVRVNPFRVIIDNSVRYYEWPKGSGNLWWEDQTFAGRLDDKGRPVRGKAHVKYTPPMTQDESIARQNMVLEQENKRLHQELLDIKREQELEQTHPKKDTEFKGRAQAEVKSAIAGKAKKENLAKS